MSRQTNNKKVSANAKYCAHCFNIGKPEAEYRSHFIRASADENSTVVCPELLATECKYCFKTGHTVTRCPIIAAKKKADKKAVMRMETEKKRQEELKQKPIQKPISVSKFAALDSDSDDEEEKQPQMVVTKKTMPKTQQSDSKFINLNADFPALSSSAKVNVSKMPTTLSYAGMAAKTRSEFEDEQFLKMKMTKRVEMPALKRNDTLRGGEEPQVPKHVDEFWAGMESDEDEIDYAINQMETKPRTIFTLKASELDWAMTADDSDDEDW